MVEQPVAEKQSLRNQWLNQKRKSRKWKGGSNCTKPAPVEQPVVAPKLAVETKPVEVEKVVVEEVKKEEPKVVETAPVKAEERKVERTAEVTATVTTRLKKMRRKKMRCLKSVNGTGCEDQCHWSD